MFWDMQLPQYDTIESNLEVLSAIELGRIVKLIFKYISVVQKLLLSKIAEIDIVTA